MGIDVYLRWDGMTEAEQQAQYTGYRIDKGDVGYLREAYHGGPYATMTLVPEGWEEDSNPYISAATLRERLPDTIMVAIYRHHLRYENGDDKTDTNDLAELLMRTVRETQDRSAQGLKGTPEQRRQVEALIEKRKLPDYALAFVDFVRLAEAKEKEIGKPCMIHVSA